MAPDPRLSNADFLTRLTTLFSTTHSASSGSIFLTQKPLHASPSSPSSSSDEQPTSTAPQILIRATDGKSPRGTKKSSSGVGKKTSQKGGEPKVKFSTVVEANQLEAFFAQYADVCKAGMQGLKKRDRKKGKKKGKGGAGGAVGQGKK
jgi:signal recognition particle subunit SRP14